MAVWYQFIATLLVVAAVSSTGIVPQSRMLNGEKGNAKSFQCFLASSSPTRFEFGSASLISYTHAITAGKLVAGYHKWILAYGDAKFGAQSKRIESRIAILHPAYNKDTNENDLGIIILPDIVVRDFLKPIALPLNSLKIPRVNEEGEVSGFGVTKEMDKATPSDELHTTYITVINTNECPIANYKVQEESNFCGRDFIKNARLCKGDTGNAFVVLQRGVPTLAGITSQVSDSCTAGVGHDASSFVRIHSYLGWIKTVTGIQ